MDLAGRPVRPRGEREAGEGEEPAAPSPPQPAYCPEPGCVRSAEFGLPLKDLAGATEHYKRCHGEKRHKCDRCGKRYGVAADLNVHAKLCGRVWLCTCGADFASRATLRKHARTFGGAEAGHGPASDEGEDEGECDEEDDTNATGWGCGGSLPSGGRTGEDRD
eukprot:SM000128S26232  [mRNA]  locus=s128:200215:201998:- [translate_table: standard]